MLPIASRTVRRAANRKQSLYASDLLYVVAEFSSRLVVGLLFLRLSSTPQQKKISKIIIGACVVCGVTSILAFAIQSNAYTTKNVMHPASLVSMLPYKLQSPLLIVLARSSLDGLPLK